MSPMEFWTVTGVIVSAILSLAGIIYTATSKRKTDSEAQDLNEFQALLNAQKVVFDSQVDALQGQINALKVELEAVKAIDRAKTIELQKLREAVQRWFRSLRAAWKSVTEAPMPYPSDADLELLGITVER